MSACGGKSVGDARESSAGAVGVSAGAAGVSVVASAGAGAAGSARQTLDCANVSCPVVDCLVPLVTNPGECCPMCSAALVQVDAGLACEVEPPNCGQTADDTYCNDDSGCKLIDSPTCACLIPVVAVNKNFEHGCSSPLKCPYSPCPASLPNGGFELLNCQSSETVADFVARCLDHVCTALKACAECQY